jgi:hypothetical protein
MAKRGEAVHVATTERRYKDRIYRTHLLRRTYRQDGKVKHQTVGNISHLDDPIIELIRGALSGITYVPASDAFEIIRSLPHGHVAAILGTIRNIGLDSLLASRTSLERELVLSMIVSRIISPASKLATARGLNSQIASSSLSEILSMGSVDEDDLYKAMDWLVLRQEAIEGRLAKRHLMEGTLVLYDVTSSYYTGTHCTLAKRGHDRDGKKGFPQIVYGLLCTREGCPVAVEVFEGNTADPKTLKVQIKKIRKRFKLQRVVFVGDRGMLTAARIREDFKPEEGMEWITALRAPEIKALMEAGAIQRSFFDTRDMAEIHSPDYPGERLIVCRNPLLAAERARKREELLRATEKALDQIVAAVGRPKHALRGAEKIGLRVGKVKDKYRVGKHFEFTISDNMFSYRRREDKIKAEAVLDGFYVIRTSVTQDTFDADGVVRAYKGLSAVERAFRSMKSVDLHVRPIFHREERRVRAHVFLCMLAYYVEWHMRRSLAPILFDDDDKEAAELMRDSVVAPAVRSPKAERKAWEKRTEGGEFVHSFRTLLEDLGTIAMNRCRAPGTKKVEFWMNTTPTPQQQKVLDMLGVSLMR